MRTTGIAGRPLAAIAARSTAIGCETTLAIDLAGEDPPGAHEVGGLAQCRGQRGLPAALPDVGVVRERHRRWLLPAGSEQ
jgi:hypothetical protein